MFVFSRVKCHVKCFEQNMSWKENKSDAKSNEGQARAPDLSLSEEEMIMMLAARLWTGRRTVVPWYSCLFLSSCQKSLFASNLIAFVAKNTAVCVCSQLRFSDAIILISLVCLALQTGLLGRNGWRKLNGPRILWESEGGMNVGVWWQLLSELDGRGERECGCVCFCLANVGVPLSVCVCVCVCVCLLLQCQRGRSSVRVV